MGIFHKGKAYTLNRVRDHVTFKEGSDSISLTVDNDANMIISGLLKAQKALKDIDSDTTEESRQSATMMFATSIFGAEQAQKLLDFYGGNYRCVLTICGIYFGDNKNGLGKKITRVQKKER